MGNPSGDKIDGDERLLYIVLQNLFENAWKYTSKEAHSSIEFGQSSRGGKAVYYVADNGVGFDMAYIDKVFDPFQRLHHVSDFEGAGVGLATVQRIIHLHGGELWADAELDKGATFFLRLIN